VDLILLLGINNSRKCIRLAFFVSSIINSVVGVEFICAKRYHRENKRKRKVNLVLVSNLFPLVRLCYLRTVPTKYRGFYARLGSCGKSKSLQGLLESTKKNGVAEHFFEIISLESKQKC